MEQEFDRMMKEEGYDLEKMIAEIFEPGQMVRNITSN